MKQDNKAKLTAAICFACSEQAPAQPSLLPR